MTRIILAAGLAALTIAATPALADSADPGGPPVEPRDPGGVAVQPVPSGPSYPGPGVETWAGRRYPPPAPPPDEIFIGSYAFGMKQEGFSAAEILMAVAGAGVEDEFEECMGKTDGMDFIDALGACFCLTVDTADAPGC